MRPKSCIRTASRSSGCFFTSRRLLSVSVPLSAVRCQKQINSITRKKRKTPTKRILLCFLCALFFLVLAFMMTDVMTWWREDLWKSHLWEPWSVKASIACFHCSFTIVSLLTLILTFQEHGASSLCDIAVQCGQVQIYSKFKAGNVMVIVVQTLIYFSYTCYILLLLI